jgi:hypothetical protein
LPSSGKLADEAIRRERDSDVVKNTGDGIIKNNDTNEVMGELGNTWEFRLDGICKRYN